MQEQIRKDGRNSFERRLQDRRQVGFAFASPEWIEHVKKDYVAWPKAERRNNNRRDGERRDDPQGTSLFGGHITDYSSDLLSNEEKLYFNELFNSAN